MVVTTLVPSGLVIIDAGHTLERRRGPRIGPAGRLHDPSLRADMPNPTSRSLRWLSAVVLADMPFAGRIWALPVLMALSPSSFGRQTQRQWSDPAVPRTPPVAARALQRSPRMCTSKCISSAERLALLPRRAAWSSKPALTFADALARLRRHPWFERIIMPANATDLTQPIAPGLQGILDAGCYAP